MMNAATAFDPGPLTWVKGEIDQALQRGEAALSAYEADGDPTQLESCREYVHQVHGALSMLTLAGPALLSESLEALLTGMVAGRLADVRRKLS